MVVALVVVGAVAVLLLRQGGSDDPTADARIREELLGDAHPDPTCPDATRAPDARKGQVAISVVRVAKGCLRYRSEVVAAADVDDRLAELRADRGVVAADRIVERKPAGIDAPDAPAKGPTEQWALAPEHLGGDKVRSLWPSTAGDVRVAIIDTGIDDKHLDLAPQIVERAPWVHRYTGEYDSHGSHVAGIVAAADDGAGVVGLTPKVRLMDVQYWDAQEHHLAGPSDDLGEYVRWAVDHGADVINMSIGGSEPSDTELTAVLYAEQQGVVVVGASGNCGGEDAGHNQKWREKLTPWDYDPNPCTHRNELKWPATYDTVLSVGAHTDDNEKADFSSANRTVDVSAPGHKIASDCLTEPDDDRVTCEASGTSQATPYVSATAALLRARHPDASPKAIRDAITKSARTDYHQPLGKRTDAFGWGIVDPEAAAKYLDDHPGAARKKGPDAKDRTQVAYVQLGQAGQGHQLMVLDDGIPHPVRPIDENAQLSRMDWSDDHSQLVGMVSDKVFTWTGPGSSLVEAPCESCDAAYAGNQVVTLGSDGTITRRDPATLNPTGTAKVGLPAPDEAYVLYGDVGEKLLIAHATRSESSGPDTLWLVDPATGRASASHGGGDNNTVGNVVLDAAGEQVAYVGGVRGGACGTYDRVYLLQADGLKEVAQPQLPSSNTGDLTVNSLFFDGKALYATMNETEASSSGEYCTRVGSAGLFRLDDDHRGWTLVDDEPVLDVRPVEGLSADPGTGEVVVPYEGQKGRFEPTGGRGDTQVQLGAVGSVWSTPTRAEVDLGRSSSTPPIDGSTTTSRPSGGGSDESTEAAIARYEDFLHALGKGDLDTICEIAGPAAKKAENDGFGPCRKTFGIVLQMISPAQHKALTTARIDASKVTTPAAGQVHIPVEAIISDAHFTEEDLGSVDLAHQDGNWFIID